MTNIILFNNNFYSLLIIFYSYNILTQNTITISILLYINILNNQNYLCKVLLRFTD